MATYQPIPVGDYKPIGVLAGIYAGENAANQEQQNRIANLAQLFDQRQKDLTYRTGEFDLEEKKYAAPTQRLVSDVTGRTAQTQLDTPGYFQSGVNSTMGQNQVNIAAGAKATALSPSDIARGRATNEADIAGQEQKGHITAIQNLIPMLDQQGALATSQFISDNYPNPKQRDLLLQAIGGGVDGMQALLNRMAASDPAQINRMAEQRLKNEGGLDVAKENSKGSIASATRAANAAIYNGGKLALAQAKDAATVALQSSKQYFDEVTASIEQWKGDKASPDYKQLLAQQKVARTRAENAVNLLVRLAKKLEEPLPLQQDGSETPKTSNQVLDYSKLP